MKMIRLAITAIMLSLCRGTSPDWDSLAAKFPLADKLPMSEAEATKAGWIKNAGCSEFSYFRGSRYILNKDRAIMLLFDGAGNIAGLQTSFKSERLLIPPKEPFVEDGDYLYLTVYFKDPTLICSSTNKLSSTSFGTHFLIQLGKGPSNFLKVPFEESKLNIKKWIIGRCSPAMGMHYWYGISKGMDCKDQFPYFLLYTGGKLRGFGWAVNADLTSPTYEHPPLAAYPAFFDAATQPSCLDTAGPISALHIYFNKDPLAITC